jgi:hypothetical protein
MDVGSSRVVNARRRESSRSAVILVVGMMDVVGSVDRLAHALDVVGIAAPDAAAETDDNDEKNGTIRMLLLLLLLLMVIMVISVISIGAFAAAAAAAVG